MNRLYQINSPDDSLDIKKAYRADNHYDFQPVRFLMTTELWRTTQAILLSKSTIEVNGRALSVSSITYLLAEEGVS